MKASELKKKPLTLEEIHDQIQRTNDNGFFKIFIQNDRYVKEELIIKLSNDGFRVYRGDWDSILTNCWIIEW